ncbi:hypothetical protein A2960_02210 [Candidatus Gottesmanbacteria bacterium RIFCSPLOWO2_01_FULL_39_12b]|uniref:PqqD family protein n=1 Tax=Candidatus Gottesmanbacteria bacterium RIFCSPLOWO2_01_FULL_39_12b TaxID=1798388 RepID=A0A1F6ARM8_9BACT|nr:MAG: hypothetical protein A2960_02210 [Candidatus Gottesmanbacteria bacterium RIFCSPLOWO2_01_FULL_39_12b]
MIKHINYKVNKGFIVQKLGNKITIFDGEESMLYTFNETATYIFQKLKAGWDKKKIIETMLKKYKTKEEKLTADFEDLIRELKAKKIISKMV